MRNEELTTSDLVGDLRDCPFCGFTEVRGGGMGKHILCVLNEIVDGRFYVGRCLCQKCRGSWDETYDDLDWSTEITLLMYEGVQS